LTRVNGHCGFFGIEVSTPEDVRRAVDRQAREGAVLVKLIASGGGLTPGTRPSEADLPLELMHGAVAAARRNGMHVSAHCHAFESIVRAIDCGVNTIEHASFVRAEGPPHFDARLAARIKDQGIAVCPTASAGTQIARAIRERGPQNYEDDNAVARLESRKWHTARFYEAGVDIIAGTDCGVTNTPFDSLVDELTEYVATGISPAAALRSATSESARHLNQPLLGRLETGCIADLIFLSGDPLQNIENLRNPTLVMKEGEIVCDFRPAQVL
jgi:imidazolonepropionase-like amidohydrolase